MGTLGRVRKVLARGWDQAACPIVPFALFPVLVLFRAFTMPVTEKGPFAEWRFADERHLKADIATIMDCPRKRGS